ncbi:hypothetical protein BDP55DRAFT_685470, partial [Colletotrichum godetiae]
MRQEFYHLLCIILFMFKEKTSNKYLWTMGAYFLKSCPEFSTDIPAIRPIPCTASGVAIVSSIPPQNLPQQASSSRL